MVLACSSSFFANNFRREPTYDELISSSFVSQQEDARAIQNWFLHHFGKTPAKIHAALTVANHQAVVSGVRHHMGLGIVVHHLVWDDVERGKIIVIRERQLQAVNRISFIQLLDKIPTLTDRTFLKHFQLISRNSKTLERLNLHVKSIG